MIELETRQAVHAAAPGIAAEIDGLMTLLELRTTEELAALLRNPGEDYPSSGLIRNMRQGQQAPSARFVTLLHARRREVDLQIRAGIYAFELAGKVRAVYHITPKRHLVPLLRQHDLEGEHVTGENMAASVPAIIAASLSVPPAWVAACAVCGRPFLRRSSRSRYCYRLNENGVNQCRRQGRRNKRGG